MCADILHEGHIILLNRAKELSENITVGLHTDEFIKAYKKKVPMLTYGERYGLLRAMGLEIVKLDSWTVASFFDYVMHGSDWKPPYILSAYQGYIEVPCTEGITSSIIKERIKNA